LDNAIARNDLYSVVSVISAGRQGFPHTLRRAPVFDTSVAVLTVATRHRGIVVDGMLRAVNVMLAGTTRQANHQYQPAKPGECGRDIQGCFRDARLAAWRAHKAPFRTPSLAFRTFLPQPWGGLPPTVAKARKVAGGTTMRLMDVNMFVLHSRQ
jgi:hypothetical protein